MTRSNVWGWPDKTAAPIRSAMTLLMNHQIERGDLIVRRKYTLYLLFTSLVLLSVTSLVGCNGLELNSNWPEREVVIDGLDGEWSGTMYYIDKKSVAVGLLNDEEYMYLCLATVDSRQVQQIIRSGLTVWFDPQGGKKESFGVNFPLGTQFSPENMNRESMPQPMSREGTADPEKLRQMLEESTKEMVVIGPGKEERRKMPVSRSQEIKVKLGYSGGKLVYELRVPLVRDVDNPDAIGLGEGRYVGVGFETAEIDMEATRERMKDGTGPGGPPTGGGMRGGGGKGGGGHSGGGRGGGSRGDEAPHRLELWTKVELASGSSFAAE